MDEQQHQSGTGGTTPPPAVQSPVGSASRSSASAGGPLAAPRPVGTASVVSAAAGPASADPADPSSADPAAADPAAANPAAADPTAADPTSGAATSGGPAGSGAGDDDAFRPPPPPAPGTLWARRDDSPSTAGGHVVTGVAPVSAAPGRAAVPGSSRLDPAGLRATTWPSGSARLYRAGNVADASVQPPLASEPPAPPTPGPPPPAPPIPGPPIPGLPSPGPPIPGPPPPGPSPVPPAPGPSPVPPAPGPSPVPPAPGPSPVPSPPPGPPVPAPPFPAPPVISGGLPAYTMPAAPREPANPPHPIGAGAVYGGGGYGGSPGTAVVGQPSAGSAHPADAQQPAAWPRSQPATPVVPHQRGEGTVYGRTGGHPAIDMTMPVSSPVESSGSLTGHILAQGWHDAPGTRERSNVKVMAIMLLVVLALVAMSVVFLFTAGDAISDMFRGLLGGKV